MKQKKALNSKFTKSKDIFEPPFSTFELSRRAADYPAVNVVPGIASS